MLQLFKSGYQKIKNALSKTRSHLGKRLKALFSNPWNESTFDELERILYEADLGSLCARDFVEHTKVFLRERPNASFPDMIDFLSQRSLEILNTPTPLSAKEPKGGEPLVFLIVGVNGSGKTTTLAKLGASFQKEGKKVLLVAGDTFRAAAIDQLQTWAERLNLELVKGKSGGDPSAVVFDALTAAKARHCDVVLIDTAGRLQNKTDLMQELEKIKRTCQKIVPGSPHETLLILDATTGQNAIDQAKTFHQFTPLTGIVLTKLDGSAKGGIILSIYKELGIPVRWIGVGEKAEDLMPFEKKSYVQALFEGEE
jgi:fused signal recognition particle receptor